MAAHVTFDSSVESILILTGRTQVIGRQSTSPLLLGLGSGRAVPHGREVIGVFQGEKSRLLQTTMEGRERSVAWADEYFAVLFLNKKSITLNIIV